MRIEGKPQSYRDLEVYSLSKELAVKVYKMTLKDLPKFEMYEELGTKLYNFREAVVKSHRVS